MTIFTEQLADRVTALAAALEPGSAVSGALAAELARADGVDAFGATRGGWWAQRKAKKAARETVRENTELVSDGLRRAAAHLAARPVRITFGGRFSSGKSSLINMLIETPLLPTGEFPETGVPCVITSGEADRVVVQTGKGIKKIPFKTDTIAKYVSVTGADGALRESIRAVRELRVTLGKKLIPAGATWVDSPGIDDGMQDARLMELPTQLARAGDILVWVTLAGPTLSDIEAEFLDARYAEAGPASVVFVLNMRLEADIDQQWQVFKARQIRYESRIAQKIDTGSVPPRIVSVSARGAAEVDPGGFGGPETRALVTGLSDPSAPHVTATRLFRATVELNDLLAKLDARVMAEEQRVAAEIARLTATQRERERQHAEFVRTVKPSVAALLSARSETPRTWAEYVIKNRLMKGTIETPGTYGTAFDELLGSAMDRIASDTVAAINQVALAHKHGALTADGARAVSRALRPGSSYISGWSPTSNRKLMQKIGDWFSEIENQRNAIKRQLAYAASDASAKMLGTTDEIARAADRYCVLATPTPPPVNMTRLNALRNAQQLLERDVMEPLRRALSAAQKQAGT